MSEPTAATGAERQPAAPRDEGRVYVRHQCDLPAACEPPSGWGRQDMKWAAKVRDISNGGISLALRRRFEPGAGLAIELPGSWPLPPGKTVGLRLAAGPAPALRLRVDSCAFEQGIRTVRCAFVDPPQPEVLRSLGLPDATA